MTTFEGTLLDLDGRPTLRFERRFPVSPARLWRAVTDEREMTVWFPSTVVGERRPGARLEFRDDPNLTGTTGHVTEWDPPRVFAFDWSGDQLRIEVVPDGDGSKLVFTHALLDRSVAARNGSGWHMCLASLDAHLVDGDRRSVDWRDVYHDYVARMGPPVATATRQWSMTWERAHHVSVERMWACLTEPSELEAWMAADVVEIDLRLGGRVRFFGEPDPEEGVIVALEPQRRIAYTWGSSLAVVDWRIDPTDGGCRYRLTKTGMPESRAAGWGAGWHSFLLQLDMYAAAGMVVVDEHEPRIAHYRSLLA